MYITTSRMDVAHLNGVSKPNHLVNFKLNPTIERFLLDPEFLNLLALAEIPLQINIPLGVVQVHDLLWPRLRLYYKHFHGRSL